MKGLPVYHVPFRIEAAKPISLHKNTGQFVRHLLAPKPAREASVNNHTTETSRKLSIQQEAHIYQNISLPVPSLPFALGNDTRIYPVKLSVVGYLSMSGALRGKEPYAYDSSNYVLAPLAPAGDTTYKSDWPRRLIPASDVLRDGNALLSIDPEAVPSGTAIADMAQERGRVEKNIDTSALALWPERLLRLEHREGVTTLWLRDFRLGPEQLDGLVNAALAVVRNAGHRISRVMVNGQEWWHATGHIVTNENGEGTPWPLIQ